MIVSVNAEMIWGQPIEAQDSSGNPLADHAVLWRRQSGTAAPGKAPVPGDYARVIA